MSLSDWVPNCDFDLSDDIILASIDNLDLYARKGQTRIKGNECVTSHMIHAVVTERILFDKAILRGPAPTADMLIRETELIVKHAALPNKQSVHETLRAQWQKHFDLAANCVSPTSMLERPPASCDRAKTADGSAPRGRTQCVSLPILVNRSTAKKVDVAAAINNVRAQFPGRKLVLVMDYQTFAVAWWLKARTPEAYEDVILVGGELHRQFHSDDCVYRLWWDYVLEPAAMWLYRKDIKQNFSADKFNNKEKFVRLVAIAGLCWLARVSIEEDPVPRDPVELIEATKANLPVWEFISFLLYAGVFSLADKEAMRTEHVSELDWAWGYTSILARSCGKTNYAKYGVLMNLVLHSSHPWVRAILDKQRTHRSSDLPCTGTGLESSIEYSVRDHKSAVVVVSDHRLSAANVAMTAKREILHDFESYLNVPDRKGRKQMVLDEDIETLIEVFNASFGSTFTESQAPQVWSKFAHRGVEAAKTGAQCLESVWGGLAEWVEGLTTSHGNHAPLIFEPPDVEDPTFIDLTMDSDPDSDSNMGGAGGESSAGSDSGSDGGSDGNDSDGNGSDGGGGPWLKLAVNTWIRNHGGMPSDTAKAKERKWQVRKMLKRSSRSRYLFEKRASEQAREADLAKENGSVRQAQLEEQEAAAAERDHEVEELLMKRVVGGEMQYRVKWLNWDSKHNSWEPVPNLKGSEMLIAKFEEKVKTMKHPRVNIHQYTQTGRARRGRGRGRKRGSNQTGQAR